MKQRGWAMAAVLGFCMLLAGSNVGHGLALSTRQNLVSERLWQWQSLAAAQAMIRWTQADADGTRQAPDAGCLMGRCAWQGQAGLTRALWQNLKSTAGTCGSMASAAHMVPTWPTLPGAQAACWIETTPQATGMLMRYTAWIEGPLAGQAMVMQAVWQTDASGAGRWVSWREVMP